MARQTTKTDKVNGQAVEEQPRRSHSFSTSPTHLGWLYGIVAVLVIIIVFMAGIGIANHRHRDMGFKTTGIAHAPGEGFGFGRHNGGGGFDGDMTSNGQSRAIGVVTSVNGGNFTIAGHGSTTNVVANSSTQYQNGNQVKQNDSVIVTGTESNGTITATRVVINP